MTWSHSLCAVTGYEPRGLSPPYLSPLFVSVYVSWVHVDHLYVSGLSIPPLQLWVCFLYVFLPISGGENFHLEDFTLFTSFTSFIPLLSCCLDLPRPPPDSLHHPYSSLTLPGSVFAIKKIFTLHFSHFSFSTPFPLVSPAVKTSQDIPSSSLSPLLPSPGQWFPSLPPGRPSPLKFRSFSGFSPPILIRFGRSFWRLKER